MYRELSLNKTLVKKKIRQMDDGGDDLLRGGGAGAGAGGRDSAPVLTKKKIRELVEQIDPHERLDADVEAVRCP